MSRQVDITKPLTPEDRIYLEARNRQDELAYVDAMESGEDLSPERQAELEQRALEEQMGKRVPLQVDPSFQRDEQADDDEEAEEFSDEDDPDDVAYVNQCSVADLKEQLKARELPTDGNKPELQRRLLDALKKESNEANS